ncbi:MAG: AEC family transporter [Candidatus Kapaibacteriota bacterium]
MQIVFISYLTLITLGVLWRFIPNLPEASTMRNAISALVIHILLPLLTISVIARAPLDDALWQIPLTGMIVTIGCLLFAWIIYRILQSTVFKSMDDRTLGSIVIGAAWCNATYLGLPIITGVFGDGMAFLPVIYDVLALTPLLWTLGVVIAGYVRGDSGSTIERVRHAAIKIVTLPPIYAVIIGLSLKYLHIELPEFVLHVSDIAGKAVPPIMMISVGMALTLPSLKSVMQLIPAMAIRLMFAPSLASLCISMFAIDAVIGKALIMESGMPTMVLTMALIDMYGLDSEILSHLIALTTMCSFITLQFQLF